VDMDRDFVRRVHDQCGGSLDVEVRGEEIGHELGLDERQTADVVARLVRTGFLRDVAAHLRIKITIRGIALVEREG
jgi:predicted regulator of amino acid metabolism with ACT domain